MKKVAIYVIILGVLGLGVWWFISGDPINAVRSYVDNSDLLTLETRFSPEDIMNAHRKELIGASGKTYQEPTLLFHPYLLLEVKYYDKNHKTKQGVILWGLMDGEMVLNSETWEKTRGFDDTIHANTTPLEFKLLNSLAEHKGFLSREKLQKELGLEQEALNGLIESAKQKQLVVIKGNDVILHFEDPLFNVTPQTKLASELVFKPYREGKKIGANYSRSQIERVAKAAFGNDFTIRSVKEIYLPVIRIPVQNQDGSLLITDWNALTGDKVRTR